MAEKTLSELKSRLESLDSRLGKGKGAARERARIALKIAEIAYAQSQSK